MAPISFVCGDERAKGGSTTSQEKVCPWPIVDGPRTRSPLDEPLHAGRARRATPGPASATSPAWPAGIACQGLGTRPVGEREAVVDHSDERRRTPQLSVGEGATHGRFRFGAERSTRLRSARLDRAALVESEPLLRESLAVRRRLFGKDDPQTLTGILSLGYLLSRKGDIDGAAACYLDAYETWRRVAGDDHPSTLDAKYNLAVALFRTGELDQADTLLHEALESRRCKIGDKHWETLETLSSLALARPWATTVRCCRRS